MKKLLIVLSIKILSVTVVTGATMSLLAFNIFKEETEEIYERIKKNELMKIYIQEKKKGYRMNLMK